MATSKLTDRHTHASCNAVLLVWGSLRLAPIKSYSLIVHQTFPVRVWQHETTLSQTLRRCGYYCILLLCLSMVCLTWHIWGRCWRKEGDLSLEPSPRGWYLVGIVPIHSNYIYILFCCVKCLWFVNSTDTHISLSHTVHNREIWGTCKGRYAGLCPRYGALFH